ncbi:MAG: poly-gamma-glutamate synthase PgsB [Acetobacteraceae bacterium]|nr:poly-gamma-glutamate synthase PgsB [Acetobacteraceae bacterium]
MVLPFISDLQLFQAVLAAAVAITLWLWLAAALHARRVRRVPLRIHVAGSRGKTSTARLIGAALRADGRQVLVKTTGTDPLLILPDGSERPWPRWAPPSISEQVRFFREAARQGAKAVVLESMAIEPEYLWASEEYLVQATHTVITNVRPDHVEVVGRDPLAAAHAMSLVIPRRGTLFLAAEAAVPPILERAARLGCRVETIVASDSAHEVQNQAMALAVARSVGVDEAVARAGFASAGQDAGSFFLARGQAGGQAFTFASAFACNDPQSLEQLWRENPAPQVPLVLFNLRDDRPERTRAFLALLARLVPAQRLVLTGHVPGRWLRAVGLDPAGPRRLRTRDPGRALAQLAQAAQGAPIWGVGNYSHLGRELVALLRREGAPC